MSSPARNNRGENGETLAFLVLWPALFVAILLLLVHTFIVVNAQAEAEVAASAGLRAAWRSAAASDFRTDDNGTPNTDDDTPYTGTEPHPETLEMSTAAHDAAAQTAGQGDGWRWWTPNSTEVKSDWCDTDPNLRPPDGQAGWVQVKVEGDVFGPMAALWPGRLDRVYAIATGPAVLDASLEINGYTIPHQNLLKIC